MGEVQVNGDRLDLDEARAVVTGYAFATVTMSAPEGRQRARWGYRTYDCAPTRPDAPIDVNDVLVVSGLNVTGLTVSTVASILAVADELTAILSCVALDATFADLDRADLIDEPATDTVVRPSGDARPLWGAWKLLRGVPGVGPAITYKLLHHKRPGYVPLLDNKTLAALRGGDGAWAKIHADLHATPDGFEALASDFAVLAGDRGGVPLTALRIHDILLWCRTVNGNYEAARDAGMQTLEG